MKLPQFTTKTLLLITATVAIGLGASTAVCQLQQRQPGYGSLSLRQFAVGTLATSPAWLPIAFFAFAAGRGRLTGRYVICLAILEVVAVGAALLAINYLD
jgi:hypothetical protein